MFCAHYVGKATTFNVRSSVIPMIHVMLVFPHRCSLSILMDAEETERRFDGIVQANPWVMAALLIGHDVDNHSQVGDLLGQMQDPLAAFIAGGLRDHTSLTVMDFLECPSQAHSKKRLTKFCYLKIKVKEFCGCKIIKWKILE